MGEVSVLLREKGEVSLLLRGRGQASALEGKKTGKTRAFGVVGGREVTAFGGDGFVHRNMHTPSHTCTRTQKHAYVRERSSAFGGDGGKR